MKRQDADREKILRLHASGKGSISRMDKELPPINKKEKTDNWVKDWAKA